MYYAGWLATNPSTNPITLTLGVLQADSTAAVDWSSLEESLQPSGVSTTAWNAIFTNLSRQLGTTEGAYIQRLDADAAYLGGLGENVTDTGQLFAFELEQAAGLSPVKTLTSVTDVSIPAPGLSLSIDRSFPNSILGRNLLEASSAWVGRGPTVGSERFARRTRWQCCDR